MYDRYGKLVNECEWCNGIESDIDEYEGDGSKPMNIEIKHLKLIDNCVLIDWDVSLLYNLEYIEIGDECFELVKTFRIDGLNRLKSLKIGKNTFTQVKEDDLEDDDPDMDDLLNRCNNQLKSFHILNCESLESIDIGRYSFSDYAGEFELKNLPQLESIQIGTRRGHTFNFQFCSFVIRGMDLILNI